MEVGVGMFVVIVALEKIRYIIADSIVLEDLSVLIERENCIIKEKRI